MIIVIIIVVGVICAALYIRNVWNRAKRDHVVLQDAPETRIPKLDVRIDPICLKCDKPLSDAVHDWRMRDILGADDTLLNGKCFGYFER